MSSEGTCSACGSADVKGWIYYCANHDPMNVRETIVEIFSRACSSSNDGLRAFLNAYAPRYAANVDVLMQVQAPGTMTQIIFELGRVFERSKFDAMAQKILEAVLAYRPESDRGLFSFRSEEPPPEPPAQLEPQPPAEPPEGWWTT